MFARHAILMLGGVGLCGDFARAAERILRFPADRAVGALYTRPASEVDYTTLPTTLGNR